MVRKADIPKLVVDAALELAAERGWRHVALADIAAEAGVKLADVHAHYRTRSAILAAFRRRIDARVLTAVDGKGEGETARDRLFEVIMARFDALAPYKAGVESILRDSACDPLAVACGAPALMCSMAWMLEAAGIPSAGPGGRLRAKGLAVLYAATLRVWLADDTPDLARTMAALDRNLVRAERLARLVWRDRRTAPPPEPEPEAA